MKKSIKNCSPESIFTLIKYNFPSKNIPGARDADESQAPAPLCQLNPTLVVVATVVVVAVVTVAVAAVVFNSGCHGWSKP